MCTKQSHFIGAVESVIQKKFLNECSNKLEYTNQEGLKTSLPVWLRLEGTSGDFLIPPACSSRLYRQARENSSRLYAVRFLSISEDGDFTTSLGS